LRGVVAQASEKDCYAPGSSDGGDTIITAMAEAAQRVSCVCCGVRSAGDSAVFVKQLHKQRRGAQAQQSGFLMLVAL
jgi:hypothetical protein